MDPISKTLIATIAITALRGKGFDAGISRDSSEAPHLKQNLLGSDT